MLVKKKLITIIIYVKQKGKRIQYEEQISY